MNAETTKTKSTKTKTTKTNATKTNATKTNATKTDSTRSEARKTDSKKPASTKPEASAMIPEGASADATDNAAAGADSPIRVLKSARCPSMSGESELDYQVGCAADGSIHLRVVGNSGGGTFSHDWIPLAAIRDAVSKAANAKAISSSTLRSLYPGRSTNSAAFLLAALKGECLVEPSKTVRRCQQPADGARFLAEVKALAAGEVVREGDGATRKGGVRATAGKAKGKGADAKTPTQPKATQGKRPKAAARSTRK